ncbi:hypothetical protein [Jatrophihabitans endophyticus]|uniref:hypothetical protein n=1 Tax=Jatrophihabitans endophyticus TaxID=1206085 RepID=UPI0019FA5DDF|nr:hypothetical protein [Jatrophihabitans endophyticus]MBE7188381.1 hypothetical protein [Jatrophihabitans endophyticus]
MIRRLLVVLTCAAAALGLLAVPSVAQAAPAAPTAQTAQPAVKSGDLTWQPAQRTDPARGVTSMSCVSKTLCRAGDKSGLVLRWNGHSWKRGEQFPDTVGAIDAVTCTSADFCAAVEELTTSAGRFYRPITRNPDGSWDTSAAEVKITRKRNYGIVTGGLSCTSATFCMLVDQQQGYQTWNGSAWSAPVVFQKENNGTLVSCASPTSCVAAGDVDLKNPGTKGKTVYRWNGSTWSSPQYVDLGDHVGGLSCPTTSFCMLTLGARYVTVKGSTVSAPKSLPRGYSAVSCTSATFCLGTFYAADGENGTQSWDGTKWHGPHKIQGQQFLTPTCASPSFCVVFGIEGDAVDRVDGSWQAPRQIEQLLGAPQDVSCGSPTLCLLVDKQSAGFAFDGSGWDGPHKIDPHADRKVVSCTGTAFCAAGTAGGQVQFRRDGHWSAPQRAVEHTGVPIDALSCASSHFCAILTDSGVFRAWKGSGWFTVGTPSRQSLESALSCVDAGCVLLAASTKNPNHAKAYVYRVGASKLRQVGPAVPDSGSLSCVSLTFCMDSGVTEGPTAARTSTLEFDGKTWKSPPTAGGTLAGSDVSCTSRSFCVLVDGRKESTWNGTQWSTLERILGSGQSDHLYAVSCRPTICAATTSDGWTVVAKRS